MKQISNNHIKFQCLKAKQCGFELSNYYDMEKIQLDERLKCYLKKFRLFSSDFVYHKKKIIINDNVL